ncbi:tryptophan 7-halogenase [Flavobacterium sp. GCM10023249]|uniref:tryptophan 7-halogenase n=1 Tax=unclassified Flavobacterium TaxID=196869 RepID=UPI0036100A97
MIDIDVFILGAGPAGCSVALNLSPFFKVMMIDRNASPQPRAGESLPPAANKLLMDMGLWDDFIQQGHLPNYGNQSVWGTDEINETDFIKDPFGHGWHLNRQKFEIWLQEKAKQRGCFFLNDTQMVDFNWREGFWEINISNDSKTQKLKSKLLIDASGRNPFIARQLGAKRIALDHLVCGWMIGKDNPVKSLQGRSKIQADSEGWWYTTAVPGNKRIIAFHTDARIPTIKSIRSKRKLLALIQKNKTLSENVCLETFTSFVDEIEYGTTAANSAFTKPFSGNSWLTVGDASFSFDPLSSQGIFNAMYTGLAAAESCYRFLNNEIDDFRDYDAVLENIMNVYKNRIYHWYAMEKRWESSPFWKNRHEKINL